MAPRRTTGGLLGPIFEELHSCWQVPIRFEHEQTLFYFRDSDSLCPEAYPAFTIQNLIEYCRRSATLKKGVLHSNPKFSIAYTNFAGRRYTDARQGSELELARNLPLTSPLFEKLFPMFFIPKGFGSTGAGNRKSSSQISRRQTRLHVRSF